MSDSSAIPVMRVQVTRDTTLSATTLRDDEVRVWVLPLDAPSVAVSDQLSNLTADERARAERYKIASARRQFTTARSMLRQILGAHLCLQPIEVPISYSGAGKPVLADAGLHFNVTHTDGLALIALAHRAVGIDVERLRQIDNPVGLIGRFFSPRERDQFVALPDELRPAGFFRGWTCKEALIKACGLSVAYLDGFDVEIDPARPAALLEARHPTIAATPWSLAAWEPEPGYAVALAVEGGGSLQIGTGIDGGQVRQLNT